jgi:hypothetical protein
MKITLRTFTIILIALTGSLFVYSDEVHTGGKVCADPSRSCVSANWKFKTWDLSFPLPRELKWQSNYYSADFYAVILTSKPAVPDPDGPAGSAECSGNFSERERLQTQLLFPNHKVFASRFGCGHMTVGCTNVNYNYNFLAVYAGETLSAANSFLAGVKATRKFQSANIRKMQVVIDYGD